MRSLRPHLVWLLALSVLLAGPAASLAECLRCPPDCPMHARVARADEGGAAQPGQHELHGEPAGHAAHGAHAAQPVGAGHDGHGSGHAAGKGDCHDEAAAPPRPGDGPCISGVCGHMDVSVARALPEAVLARPRAVAPLLAVARTVPPLAAAATRLAEAPPTEPPRPLPS